MGMHDLNQSNTQADVLSSRPASFTQQVSGTYSQTLSQQNNAKKIKKRKKERGGGRGRGEILWRGKGTGKTKAGSHEASQ